jgi:hypothetical protein
VVGWRAMVDARDCEIYVVVGWGKPTMPSLLHAPSNVWNWAIAQLLCGLSEPMTGLLEQPDRWCKILHAKQAELQADSSVVAYQALHIPSLARAAWDPEYQGTIQQSLDFEADNG